MGEKWGRHLLEKAREERIQLVLLRAPLPQPTLSKLHEDFCNEQSKPDYSQTMND